MHTLRSIDLDDFVMARPEDILDARVRFARGDMGALAPSVRPA